MNDNKGPNLIKQTNARLISVSCFLSFFALNEDGLQFVGRDTTWTFAGVFRM